MAKRTRYALFSVSDKTGLPEFAKRLVSMDQINWQIYASGGTAKALKAAGFEVIDVSVLVGGDSILGHRVVTISRELAAGLLADKLSADDMRELMELNIPLLDMVVCDFYPLKDAIAKPDATIESVVKDTDIGGPNMVRAGAKGLRIVLCRHKDWEPVLHELEQRGEVSPETRQSLRAIAEFVVAGYVMDSARFHGKGRFEGFLGERVGEGFKGENGPQGPAFLYSYGTDDPLALDKFQVDGNPGFVNRTDIDRLLVTLTHIAAAWKLNFGYVPRIAVAVKHGNPCGAAVGRNAAEVVRKMVTGDTLAVFGGWVMCNFPVTKKLAEVMVTTWMKKGKSRKLDGVVAPAFGDGVADLFKRRKRPCLLVTNPALETHSDFLDPGPKIRQVRGGFIKQGNYNFVLDLVHGHPDMKVFGGRTSRRHVQDLLLAWAVCATSNSNTITIVKDGMLIGNGVGQQARVWAAKLARMRARDAKHKDLLRGASGCSDSFFPFTDGPRLLIRAGVKCIFSTSGSDNDDKVQALCVRKGVTLVQLPDSLARGFFGH